MQSVLVPTRPADHVELMSPDHYFLFPLEIARLLHTHCFPQGEKKSITRLQGKKHGGKGRWPQRGKSEDQLGSKLVRVSGDLGSALSLRVPSWYWSWSIPNPRRLPSHQKPSRSGLRQHHEGHEDFWALSPQYLTLSPESPLHPLIHRLGFSPLIFLSKPILRDQPGNSHLHFS